MKTGTKSRRLRRAAISLATGGALFAGGTLAMAPAEATTVPPLKTVTIPTIAAKGGYALESENGRGLYGKSADVRRPTGSTTKIMTAKVVLSQASVNLDTKVTIQQAYRDYVAAKGASTSNLVAGDKVTVRDLLFALMLPSGCDAAYALADKFGTGTTRAARVKSFIGKMNTTAKNLGMTNTNFDSFDGISNGSNYSTPRDLTKLARNALGNSSFRYIVKTKSYTAKTTTTSGTTRTMAAWKNTNPLLGSYSGAIGVKTGSGSLAGYCLVFAAVRNGHTVIGAVLSSTSATQRTTDATRVLNFGYARLG